MQDLQLMYQQFLTEQPPQAAPSQSEAPQPSQLPQQLPAQQQAPAAGPAAGAPGGGGAPSQGDIAQPAGQQPAGAAGGQAKRASEGGEAEEPPAKQVRPMPTRAMEWVERQEEFFPGMPKLPEGWVRAKARSTGKTYYLRLRDTHTTYNLNEVYRDQGQQASE